MWREDQLVSLDPGLPGLALVSGLLAVMDFEKACDRLPHTYLDVVLCAVGLGPKARRWSRATSTEGHGHREPGPTNDSRLLLADDACCALHNLSDLAHLNRAFELYERASASKLSNAKSFLYPLGSFRDRPIGLGLGTWRLSISQFRYLGIQVGVEIAEDAGWEEIKSCV
ncbi:BZ3500_MvSof-1268-A1-R1_Chr2-1g04085 [Microbotryum saponariae]|uniref:BZ3500_MvSof-1268-A1-R1_Chr2-1g04085 protein n=1 Tax=Microbotryum saponariae TaxID=289078 RepID=A0A2X0K5B4_9BASI|nr:BZ3500_MvSof-1268-A1-R1_Chr2-1g04085 [Microbotryum saponariae]SCZ91072.1 BZ3501_MvSof-1269-A2-R1_Chr2-1g03741 [Microbotryum saponariae]